MLRIIIVTATLTLAVAGLYAQDRVIIGDARMENDGTIVVRMRRTADGLNVSGEIAYAKDNPHYKAIFDHIGGIKPGEVKLVPAWDDAAPKKQ